MLIYNIHILNNLLRFKVYCDEGKRKKLKTLSLVLLNSNV